MLPLSPAPPRFRRATFWALMLGAAVVQVVLVATLVTIVLAATAWTGSSTGPDAVVAPANLTEVLPGLPGCQPVASEVCFSVVLHVSGGVYGYGLRLSQLTFSVRSAGFSGDPSLVLLPTDARISALDSNGLVVATASFSASGQAYAWSGDPNYSIEPQVAVVLDSGLTADSLAGDYLWVSIEVVEAVPGIIALS
jgi:hypothetical protein